MRNIIKIIISIILSIIVSLTIYFSISSEQLLVKFYGIGILIVSSGSMEPELAVGDIIIIKSCENYNVNDIVTYNVDNSYLVTHRIIIKDGTNYITKGDNNNVEDKDIVFKENIEGKVICNSKILKFIYNHMITIVLVIALLLIIF